MPIFSKSGKSQSLRGETPRGAIAPNFASAIVSTGDSTFSTPAPPVRRISPVPAPEKTGNSGSPSMQSTAQRRREPADDGCLLNQTPDSRVAETLKMKGELEFTRLLRVDGRFEGKLISNNGSLIIGPKGEVIGDLENMEEVYVEGTVRGNVCAQKVNVKNAGTLIGDIQCLYLTLDPTASLKGLADTATLKERALEGSTKAKVAGRGSSLVKLAPRSSGDVTSAPPASTAGDGSVQSNTEVGLKAVVAC